MLDEKVSAAKPRETKPSERAAAEAERLNSRLSSTHEALQDLRVRVSGPTPPSAGSGAEAATAFTLGGFVGGVGQALERANTVLSQINEVIQELAEVI